MKENKNIWQTYIDSANLRVYNKDIIKLEEQI